MVEVEFRACERRVLVDLGSIVLGGPLMMWVQPEESVSCCRLCCWVGGFLRRVMVLCVLSEGEASYSWSGYHRRGIILWLVVRVLVHAFRLLI